MEDQDWQGKHLDKDILIGGNKLYGPESCIFVSGQLNNLLLARDARRGEYPQGVSWASSVSKYRASCMVNSKSICVGHYSTESKAEKSYLEFKSVVVREAAFEIEASSNARLQAALIAHADNLLAKAIGIENNEE